MAWKEIEPTEKCHTNRNTWILILIVFALIGLFLWRIIPAPTQGVVLSGNGFNVNIHTRAIAINRYVDPYEQTSSSGNIQGALNPRAANTYFNYTYHSGFEDTNHNWTSPTGAINKGNKYVFQGDKSYRTKQGTMALAFTDTANINDTYDILFYAYLKDNVTNGYIAFSFNLTHDGESDQFVFVLEEAGANAFSSSYPLVHEYAFQGTAVDMWSGFLVENLRSLAIYVNSSLDVSNLTLSAVQFMISESQGQIPSLYVDEFSIQKYPASSLSGLWYETNVRKTDYQFIITYDIQVDIDVIDLDTFTLRADIQQNITGLLNSVQNQTVDLSIIGNFVWSDIAIDIYDKAASGTYYSVIHPLPQNNNYFGNTAVYTFSATYTGGGFSYEGEAFSDDGTEAVSGFTVNWLKPINVT